VKSASLSVPEHNNNSAQLVIDTLIDAGLLVVSSVLFFFAFPNVFSTEGALFPLAFIAIIPVFIVVHRSGWIRIFFYGACYGGLTYALFNYWLATFHPAALVIVPIIYAVYFLLLFPALKLIDTLFPEYGYIVQAFAWIGYEYLRTQGYLGYSYGILGYSQYIFLPLAHVASVAGVWGVSFLIVFPQTIIANALKNGFSKCLTFLKRHLPVFFIYAGLLCTSLIYGFLGNVDYHASRMWKVALIQQNSNPWKNNYEEYEKTLDSLILLSNKSLTEKPDIVIWSETAFVPAIEYHLKYRESQEAARVVVKLIDFLKTQDVPYIIGNDEGVKIQAGTNDEKRIDYNAALLFDKSEVVKVYRKLHLVPFTEHFPYRNTFPDIYNLLVSLDTHFWEAGSEYTVFEHGGVKFSTPICFEDTFGYLCERFCNRGAEVLVNLTNDSWSGSVVSEVQHMAIAVFRAIENQRTLVRSTNSGITCVIDPNGKILRKLEPFNEDFLVSNIPVYSKGMTLYRMWEDWFAILLTILSFACIALGIARRFAWKKRVDKMGEV
jgi:apolipoprotein N-acyltransferase